MSPLTGLPLSSYEPVRRNKHYKPTHILLHQDQVNAVMMAIKPGYHNIYCKKYSKEMVLDYLDRIRTEDVVNYGFQKSNRVNQNHASKA